jgi:hypothetical protein
MTNELYLAVVPDLFGEVSGIFDVLNNALIP